MIDTTNFSLFVAASWALIIAPGPDMLYVLNVPKNMQAGKPIITGGDYFPTSHTSRTIAAASAIVAVNIGFSPPAMPWTANAAAPIAPPQAAAPVSFSRLLIGLFSLQAFDRILLRL